MILTLLFIYTDSILLITFLNTIQSKGHKRDIDDLFLFLSFFAKIVKKHFLPLYLKSGRKKIFFPNSKFLKSYKIKRNTFEIFLKSNVSIFYRFGGGSSVARSIADETSGCKSGTTKDSVHVRSVPVRTGLRPKANRSTHEKHEHNDEKWKERSRRGGVEGQWYRPWKLPDLA